MPQQQSIPLVGGRAPDGPVNRGLMERDPQPEEYCREECAKLGPCHRNRRETGRAKRKPDPDCGPRSEPVGERAGDKWTDPGDREKDAEGDPGCFLTDAGNGSQMQGKNGQREKMGRYARKLVTRDQAAA